MKRPAIWTLALLAVCAVFTLSAPEGRAAEIHVSDPEGLRAAVAAAHDGDTVILDVDCTIMADNDDPWVIDKAVTIQGCSISCRKGGILLAADVTFQNTAIGFSSFVCDSIMANGYTLTLDNVTYPVGARPVNLVCGGLYTETGYYGGYDPANGGKIVIRGRTSLASTHEGVGNIYAGNLCLGGMTEDKGSVHGPANTFYGSPEIIIEAEQGSELGRIYAGGVEEKIPEGQPNGKVFLTNQYDYKVSGTVSIQLHAATVTYVNGLGAGGTDVTYTDTGDYKFVTDTLGLYQIDSLTVESGHVSPLGDSSFVSGASLAVASGAKLGLEQMGNVTVGSFTGGGYLCLEENQLLTVTGTVSGETGVVIGGFTFDDKSSGMPTAGKTYIQAPNSTANSFTLAPPNARPGMSFTLDGGSWSVVDNTTLAPVVARSLRFENAQTSWPSGNIYAELPLIAEFVNEGDAVDYLPMEISVNGIPAAYLDGESFENGDYLHIELNDVPLLLYVAGDALCVEVEDYENTTIPDGTYQIVLTVPGTNTVSGKSITASATLVVGGSQCELQEIELTGGAVRIRLTGPIDAGTTATVLAAVYDAGGKMLRCGSVPAAGAASVDVPVSTAGGAEVRAFLTGDGQSPLCPSLSKTLP